MLFETSMASHLFYLTQVFDLASMTWMEPQVDEERPTATRREVSYAAAVSYGGEMLLLGGYDDGGPNRRRDVVRMGLEAGGSVWTTRTRLKLTESRAEMAVLFVADEYCF